MKTVADPRGDGTLLHFVTEVLPPADQHDCSHVVTLCGQVFDASTSRPLIDHDLTPEVLTKVCFQCQHKAKLRTVAA